MGGMQGVNGEPKPFGLAVDEQSQATTPDTTPARTPTDDSTPTSEPNPFPFHEGKMFEMTRSGAIDMSKRDMVEERLQFFQIGEHSYSAGKYNVRDSEIVASIQHRDHFSTQGPTNTSSIPQVSIQTTTVKLEVSNLAGSYSTCRNSASTTELKFSTFRTEFKLPSDKHSGSPDSNIKCRTPCTFNDMPSGTALDSISSYDVASNHEDSFDLNSLDPADFYSNHTIHSCMSKPRDHLDWSSGNQDIYYQSTDCFSAPSQDRSNSQTWSTNTSCNIPVSHFVDSDVVQTGSNLLSSSGLTEISRIDAGFNQLEVKSREGRFCPNVAIINMGAKEVKAQICKSKLPVRVPDHKLCSQTRAIGKGKAQENVDRFRDKKHAIHKVRERCDPFETLFPKSRIPVMKAIQYSSSSQGAKRVTNKTVIDRSIKKNIGKKQQTKCTTSTEQKRSLVKISGRSRTDETGRKTCLVVPKNFKARSVSSQVAKSLDQTIPKEAETRLEGKKLPTEDEESCSLSTTRNTSLSETPTSSRGSCPSRTSTSTSTSTTTSTPSARDVKAEVEQASSEMRRSKRKSRRTLGEKEHKFDQPVKAPVSENKTSPQSPCERTDLRMAIVADHLGLSWTELARELEFSVEEINFIRVENPNSLTAQSFMLLKKWVHRDGKNATTDALTTALTKINRLDIVTLLEGPIFDYGNISGTRCFADDNAVFPDQSDGKV
uniref:ankyrin-3-like isoform X1 n=1 Tax=Solea senegalensis TaxID=28829 RepID=UPI001CD91306|nr:ankyrin-3-like isoform X1 [Solea senegalensis]